LALAEENERRLAETGREERITKRIRAGCGQELV
jgi:hypothetical protein